MLSTARLNAEPPVLLGCSQTELVLIVGLGLVLCAPVAWFVATGIGMGILTPALLIGAMLLVVPVAAMWLVSVKAGRPEGWHVKRAFVALLDVVPLNAPERMRVGEWEIGL